MLNGIHLVDFGNHRNTRLTFGRMTALVGQNGAGKTTVMRAVHVLGQAFRGSNRKLIAPGQHRSKCPMAALAGAWGLEMAGAPSETGVTVTDHASWELRKLPLTTLPGQWIPSPNIERLTPEKISEQLASFRNSSQEFRDSSTSHERIDGPRFQWACRHFKIDVNSLHYPDFVDPNRSALNDDGANLAWALSSLMTEHPEKFQRIVEALKEVVPVVKRIRSRAVSLTRAEKQTITINKQERTFDEERSVPGQELIFDMKSGDNLPASMVSEGTLVVLAVLTLVHGSDDADLIMLDDVELGLHPKAQRDLIRQLRRIQETHPQLQIILSTHSPYVVDEMKPEEVWVFAPDAEGCAVAHRLDEHPNAKRALDVLTTGEFWSAEGEGWVLDAPTEKVAETPPSE